MFSDPQQKIRQISNREEQRIILGLQDIIEGSFGFNFVVDQGHVIEIQLVSAGLVSIPRTLGELPRLKCLHLENNKIRRLRNLDRCKNLEIIYLMDNQLNDDSFQNLRPMEQIKAISMKGNAISSTNFLELFPNINSLNLAQNRIQTVDITREFSELRFLDLQSNPITTLFSLQKIPHLLDLKITPSSLSSRDQEIYAQGTNKMLEIMKKN